MPPIPVEHIRYEKRELDEKELQDIIDSIREQGLLHPVTVRPANNNGYDLIAGLKRVIAHERLERSEIEATVIEATDNEVKILRCHENLHRHNLPWHEQVVLTRELHDLRQAEHGVATRGRPQHGETKQGWGIRDTARELGVALGPLSEDLNLARAVAVDPSLKNIKDKKTAIRLVKQAARRHTAELEHGAPPDIDVNQIYCGDSASVLQQFPDNIFDGCITDPPWLSFYDESLTRDERTLPVFKELYRVLKFNSFLYVIVGHEDFFYYEEELPKIGFQVSKTPLIWVKENALSRRGVRAWEYDRDFELILLAVKGNPVLTESGKRSSIKRFPVVPSRKLVHPNEKPIELIKEIIEDCTFKGATLIEPFGGSGVLGVAAKRTGRNYIIIERDKDSYDKIVKRLE